jgi:hypothetical protein
MELPPGIKIKENSLYAKMAAYKLSTKMVAIVFANTIHLYGVSKQLFLKNESWVKHELKHVEQYSRLGFANFLWQYLIESIKHGYTNNRFEVEAREAEKLP